jgi:hypothetical protein
LEIEGVVGVAIGKCEQEECIKVFVIEKNPELDRSIPKQLDGYKVDIDAIGTIEIQSAPTDESSLSIFQIQRAYESELLEIEGVIGVAIGKCEEEECIKVFVIEKTPELDRSIPKQLGGYKVDIEAIGTIEIQPAPTD